MPEIYTNSLMLERGIEGVSHLDRDTDDRELWPERRALPPPSQGVKAHLAELLNPPDTTRYLTAALQPMVSNPELLMPAKYHATLTRARQDLNAAIGPKSENTRIVNRAIRLLSEEIGLRELANLYRSALYQG